jgi:hypothetical protein
MHKIDALQLHPRNLLAAISLYRFVYMCGKRSRELRTQSGANACT